MFPSNKFSEENNSCVNQKSEEFKSRTVVKSGGKTSSIKILVENSDRTFLSVESKTDHKREILGNSVCEIEGKR